MAALKLNKLQNVLVTIFSSSHQGPFKKWCNSGVVSAISHHEIVDYTGFPGTFQDTAVAYEKYFYHCYQTP